MVSDRIGPHPTVRPKCLKAFHRHSFSLPTGNPSSKTRNLCSFFGVRLASAAADVVAKRVGAVPHAVAAPAILVSTTSAFATFPSSVELLKAAPSR